MAPPVSIPSVLSTITEPYSQKLIATLDDAYDMKVAFLHGPFIFHSHDDSDELFYVLSGDLIIELRHAKEEKDEDGDGHDGIAEVVKLNQGDVYVVPRGVMHRPIGKNANVMVVEKKGVVDGRGKLAAV